MALEAAKVAQGSLELHSLPVNQSLGGAVPPIYSEPHSLDPEHTFFPFSEWFVMFYEVTYFMISLCLSNQCFNQTLSFLYFLDFHDSADMYMCVNGKKKGLYIGKA